MKINPCIDCLTLASCRSYYLQEIEKGEGNTNHGYHSLRNKCCLLDDFFKQDSHISHQQYAFAYRAFISYIEEGKIYHERDSM